MCLVVAHRRLYERWKFQPRWIRWKNSGVLERCMVAYERSFDDRKGVKFIVRQLLTLDNVCCKRQRHLVINFSRHFSRLQPRSQSSLLPREGRKREPWERGCHICRSSFDVAREVKHHVHVKQQTRICTTWPSFNCCLLLITSTQKWVVSRQFYPHEYCPGQFFPLTKWLVPTGRGNQTRILAFKLILDSKGKRKDRLHFA